MPKERLSSFRYAYQKGPRPACEAGQDILEGNCRLALQDYFLVFHDKIFIESELLNPEAYLHTGRFLKKSPGRDFFEGLPTGTVIYAERVRSKDGSRAAKTLADFSSMEDYLVSLHSAIFIEAVTAEVLGKLPIEIVCLDTGPAIWHATFIQGRTCLWRLEEFSLYYRPVAAKSFTPYSLAREGASIPRLSAEP